MAAFVEAYGPFLLAVVRHRTGTGLPDRAVDAEDVVADILLRVFEDDAALLKGYAGRSSLKAYLAATAAHAAIDALRRGRIRAAGRIPMAAAPEPVADYPQEADRFGRGLEAALKGLSPADRDILRRRYVDGWSYRRIAAEAGVPEGTAAARLARARAKLRRNRELAHEYGDWID